MSRVVDNKIADWWAQNTSSRCMGAVWSFDCWCCYQPVVSHLSPCVRVSGHTLGINSDSLEASCCTYL